MSIKLKISSGILITAYIFNAVKLSYLSAQLLKLSCNFGNTEAMSALGNAYYFGHGVKQSYREAFELYLKSAKLGNRYGSANLAHMYYEGLSIQKDINTAAIWYEKAADMGHTESKEMLAVIEGEKSNS